MTEFNISICDRMGSSKTNRASVAQLVEHRAAMREVVLLQQTDFNTIMICC